MFSSFTHEMFRRLLEKSRALGFQWCVGEPKPIASTLYLKTEIGTFADVFGPVWGVQDRWQPDLISRYNVGGGSILPWPFDASVHPELQEGERLCHWKRNGDIVEVRDLGLVARSMSSQPDV